MISRAAVAASMWAHERATSMPGSSVQRGPIGMEMADTMAMIAAHGVGQWFTRMYHMSYIVQDHVVRAIEERGP